MDKLMKKMQRLAYIVNSLIALYVVFFVVIFRYAGATYLWKISLGALLYYAIAYILIWKKKLQAYVASLYLIIIAYMFVATICVGLNSGFQVYCLSMIPLLFYFDYLGEQLNMRKSKPLLYSALIGVTYYGCTEYVLVSGSIYEIDRKISVVLLGLNSLWVLFLLIFYSSLMIKLVREYERMLKEQAMVDRLTGLYNRHFMMDQLKKIDAKDATKHWVAIFDIDNFKAVNDIYGHNAGDAVLIGVADILQEVCSECTYARWGGEEFLITASNSIDKEALLERLRQAVADKEFVYEDKTISVTITVGVSSCTVDESVDRWIQRADKLLYEGKNSGKNRVVM